MDSLDALSTLMMNSDTVDVGCLEVRDRATTEGFSEGWATLAKALSKTSVRVRHLLAARELMREGREEDLATIHDKCWVSPLPFVYLFLI